MTPDAIPSRLGRYSCPITTETLNDITVTKPIPASSTPARTPAGREHEPDQQRDLRERRADQHPAPPDAVDEPAADERADRARGEHAGERGVAARLGRAVLRGSATRGANDCRPK